MKIDSICWRVRGQKRLGVRYAPSQLKKSAPTLLMFHGFPGAEKNVDIARAMTERGWICFLPHFRGSWGSHGKYSFSGILEDAREAFHWLRRDPQVDSARLAVLGFSMGGWAAINMASQEKKILAVVALAPMAGSKQWFHAQSRAHFFELSKALDCVKPKALWEEFKKYTTEHDPLDVAPRIAPRPLLIVHGTQDEMVPHNLGFEVFQRSLQPKKFVSIKNADHQFSEHRRPLIKTVVSWLERALER